MKKPAGTPGTTDPRATPAKGDIYCHRQHVWELMTDSFWDDGSPRDRASILLFMEGSVAKLWVNDKAMGREAWVTAESHDAALDTLEEQLATESVQWRMSDPKKRRK